MSESTREVENGVVRANQAGQVLESITQASDAVFQQASQATKAAVQMKSAVSELVGVVESVSAVIEENTAATEKCLPIPTKSPSRSRTSPASAKRIRLQ